jgi:hypothetical protein
VTGARGPKSRTAAAIAGSEADVVETPLLQAESPAGCGIRLYPKGESRQPSGSVKRRLLGSASVDVLEAGRLAEGDAVVQAGAGPAAVAGATPGSTGSLAAGGALPRPAVRHVPVLFRVVRGMSVNDQAVCCPSSGQGAFPGGVPLFRTFLIADN